MIQTGWLLDLFEDTVDGAAVWLLADDGRRLRLRQHFPAALCVRGEETALLALQKYLGQCFPQLVFRREERHDVFLRREVEVLAVETPRAGDLPAVLRAAARAFPRLEYADADLALSLRYAARTGLFPLARCRMDVGPGGWIHAAEALNSPWDMEHAPAPLRVLDLVAEETPGRGPAHKLIARAGKQTQVFSLEPARALLVGLRRLLETFDPDLILAARGDTWLMPLLLDQAERCGIPLPLNRDGHTPIARRKERWYYSYGQLVYRGEQVMLSGRWHIDRHNAMLWDDYDLEGVFELARVTGLPVQTAARVSPGTGIAAVQMLAALRLGILVPWQKQQPEMMKSAWDLFTADQGGLVYQPKVGLHRNVAGLDFVSMYPAIMVNYNISPETVSTRPAGWQPDEPQANVERVPELNLWIDQSWPGLVPQSLVPLLQRRVAFKELLNRMPVGDPCRPLLKKRASALKWLLVTCFGYLGYKNARFGRIEAHQAVTAYGREALLCAKEAAEDAGFEVIHLYVDGMWVQGSGDLPALCEEILRRTRLSIGIEGIYRWVAFLPSRVRGTRAAANRYFGSFEDGTLKVRGIEARRHDTPPLIAALQLELLEILARRTDPTAGVEEALARVRSRLAEVRRGLVPLEDLLISHKLGREPEEYKANSAAARAARQLQAAGVTVKPGQRLRFLYTLGRPGVWAWELPGKPPCASIDIKRYEELAWRAAAAVLGPLTGKNEFDLRAPEAPQLPFPPQRLNTSSLGLRASRQETQHLPTPALPTPPGHAGQNA
jgi:DNA polymerase-2